MNNCDRYGLKGFRFQRNRQRRAHNRLTWTWLATAAAAWGLLATGGDTSVNRCAASDAEYLLDIILIQVWDLLTASVLFCRLGRDDLSDVCCQCGGIDELGRF
jgi:hypothetical protein